MADAPFVMPTRIVRIRWEDACSYDEGGWISWEKVQAAELSFIQSTGFVAKETDKYIVLVGSICEEDGTAGSDVCIPKANIVELTELTP
jgi:hypothetical protein